MGWATETSDGRRGIAAAEGTSKLVDVAAGRSCGHKLLVVASNQLNSGSPDNTAVTVAGVAIAPCGPCSATAAAEAMHTQSGRTSVTAQTQAQAQEQAPRASAA
jgi:hypothetical protein